MTDTLVITGAQVFDGEAFLGTHDVLVRGGVIEAVRSTEAGGTPLAAEASAAGSIVDVVDGTGKTLTPGLIDCHVHVATEGAGSLDAFVEPFSLQFFRAARNLEKTLQAGVTTARDAGGADAGVKTALAQGLVEGPDLRAAISIMSQTGGHGDGGWHPVPTCRCSRSIPAGPMAWPTGSTGYVRRRGRSCGRVPITSRSARRAGCCHPLTIRGTASSRRRRSR